MMRNEEQIKGRQRIVNMAMNDPKKAAEYFRKAAQTLEQCVTKQQIGYALSDILFLSLSTINTDHYSEKAEADIQ